MARPLLYIRDFSGNPSTGSATGYDSPEWTQQLLLTGDTVASITVPEFDGNVRLNAFFGFSSGAVLFYCPSDTPTLTLPIGDTAEDSINEILIPGCGRTVLGGQKIQLLSADNDLYVTISYYGAIP